MSGNQRKKMMISNYREVADKQDEEQTKQKNAQFNKMADIFKRPENEQEFIDKQISQWDAAYANKCYQKDLLRIIFDRLQKLESYSSFIEASKFNSEDGAGESSASASSSSNNNDVQTIQNEKEQ